MKLRRYVGRVIPPVLFVLLLPIALAAPTVLSRDRADNSLFLTYDADDDSIESATSSVRHKRDDPVEFLTLVDESSGAQPLVGRINLRLLSKRPVVYDGTFRFIVRDATGAVAFSEDRVKAFTLRPRAGSKFESLRFSFDLPSGDYEVTARFVATDA